MPFLLADSFQSSLGKLSGEEQKAAKLAALELQINPAHPVCNATGSTTSRTRTSGQPVPAVTSG